MKKKLLFVIPNQRWLKSDIVTTWDINPRFLCVMGAIVEDLVDVEILDCQRYGISADDCAAHIRQSQPDFIGISILTSEYAEILDIAARICRTERPGAIVIVGGVHVTMEYLGVAANPDIDYACRGEGDLVLRNLLLFLLGKLPELPPEGWVYRDGPRIVTGSHAIVEDLSALPSPNYELVHYEDYTLSHQRRGPNQVPELPGSTFNIARGCPCPCTFCQVGTISGKRIRTRTAEQIVDEIQYLQRRYGIRSLAFFDDNFFLSKKVAKETLRMMIERRVGIKWNAAGFAIFALDDEFLDLIAASGCTMLNIAIESGNERVLRELIKKPIKDLATLPATLRKVKAKGIFVIANFIIGYPGETWDEIMDTIRYAEYCEADYVKFFVAVPLKGTAMFEMAQTLDALDNGAADLKVDWRHSQVHSEDWTGADISALRVYEWDRINFSPERMPKMMALWDMSPDEINAMRRNTRQALHQ